MKNEIQHTPVLCDEVIDFLSPKQDGIYVDATVGCGGHAEKILEKLGENGRLIGIDIDPDILEIAKKRLEEYSGKCVLVCDSYINLNEILQKEGISSIDGILFDLGTNIEHFLKGERGFSIKEDGPLDMRFNRRFTLTAEKIVNTWKQDDLIKILYRYGEERNARRITRFITEERKKKRITTTGELRDLVIRAIGKGRSGRIHPATRTFQALRIAVNNELENLEKILPTAISVLKPGGRICVISFHSLEDRIVKNLFRSSKDMIRNLTKKPVVPKSEELVLNPHSRSAKLRVAEKI